MINDNNFNHKMELKGYISLSNFPIKFSTFIFFNYLDMFKNLLE